MFGDDTAHSSSMFWLKLLKQQGNTPKLQMWKLRRWGWRWWDHLDQKDVGAVLLSLSCHPAGIQQVNGSQDVLDGWELWGGKVPLKTVSRYFCFAQAIQNPCSQQLWVSVGMCRQKLLLQDEFPLENLEPLKRAVTDAGPHPSTSIGCEFMSASLKQLDISNPPG